MVQTSRSKVVRTTGKWQQRPYIGRFDPYICRFTHPCIAFRYQTLLTGCGAREAGASGRSARLGRWRVDDCGEGLSIDDYDREVTLMADLRMHRIYWMIEIKRG